MLEWAVAMRPAEREKDSGDACLVWATPHGTAVAAVDGLGHGPAAAAAARSALTAIKADQTWSVEDIVLSCHHELRRMRGAVLAVGLLPRAESKMAWLSVGNIESFVVHAEEGRRCVREALPTRGGVVGYRLPPLHPSLISLSPGDLLVMATDGVASGFGGTIRCDRTPSENADAILALHGKLSDDALVLVARYVGGNGAPRPV